MIEALKESLSKVRWSTGKVRRVSVPGVQVKGEDLSLTLDYGSDGFVLIAAFGGKRSVVKLDKSDYETRGKSMWLKDNTWRLSSEGIERWSADLEKAIGKSK
jgi:hypothetical protein